MPTGAKYKNYNDLDGNSAPPGWRGRCWQFFCATWWQKTILTVVLLTAWSLLMVLPPLAPSEASLIMLQLGQHKKAMCLDGSPAGYYMRSGDPVKFVITLQGGTPCVEKTLCKQQSTSKKGSSRAWKEHIEFKNYVEANFFANITLNPEFSDYTQVFIPYCSGDMWAGTQWQQEWNLYFHGHYILDAVLDELIMMNEIQNAEMVIFSGGSTGAMGVFNSLDYVAQKLPGPRVVGVPIAGWVFDNNETYTGSGELKYTPLDDAALQTYYQLWQPFIPQGCKNVNPDAPWKCQIADVSFDSISSELFVVQAQTDASMMSVYDGMPQSNGDKFTSNQTNYMSQWAEQLNDSLEQVMEHPRAGLFSPACYMHTGFGYTDPWIAKGGMNMTYIDAFSQWLHVSTEKVKMQNSCGISDANFPNCNPSCPKSTT